MITTSRVAINEKTIAVGLGEMMATKDPALSLACFGIGSCICLCAYDPRMHVAGMAHIVLPKSNGDVAGQYATKYADVAVPRLVESMVKIGASKTRLVTKLVGGAQMIQSVEFSDILEMGNRNLEMTKKALQTEGISISATDTGGNNGRSVWMLVESGKVMVRKAGQEAREL
jgi:chemotaxis protein CheD